MLEAQTACTQLGFRFASYAYSNLSAPDYPHLMHQVHCNNGQASLYQCDWQILDTDVCQNMPATGIFCTDENSEQLTFKYMFVFVCVYMHGLS